MATPITLTATLQDFTGASESAGSLIIALCNFGSSIPRVAGTSILADCGPTQIEAVAGVVTTPVWGNDQITPQGTYYCIEVANENGDVVQCNLYQFTGSGGVDLSTATPIDPNIGTPAFQFATTDIFLITLTGANRPGSTYTLRYSPYNGTLLGLFYNGNYQIPGLHYTLTGQTITLNFSTGIGDNLAAVYVASAN